MFINRVGDIAQSGMRMVSATWVTHVALTTMGCHPSDVCRVSCVISIFAICSCGAAAVDGRRLQKMKTFNKRNIFQFLFQFFLFTFFVLMLQITANLRPSTHNVVKNVFFGKSFFGKRIFRYNFFKSLT